MTSINQNNIDSVFTKASINDEVHDLFPSIESMSSSINPPVIGTPPDPPMYMTIRVDRKRMTKKSRFLIFLNCSNVIFINKFSRVHFIRK